MEILFHERNNEILKDSEEGRRLLELIKEKEYVTEFTSEHSNYGYFHNFIYSVIGGLVILSVWRPNTGYSWSEKMLVFIPIPESE